MKERYSLPFKKCRVARHCTAPAHFSIPNTRFCIDFYLPRGTPVLAARVGVVTETESQYNKSFQNEDFIERCNYVTLRHSDGQESIYAHLAWRSIKVKRGMKVRRGQVIGLSGQVGYATYPHLHFGVYNANGKNIPAIFNTPLPTKTDWRKFASH